MMAIGSCVRLTIKALNTKNRTTRWLAAHPIAFTLYTSLAAFCLYTCVYAFRKTFAAATFDDLVYAGISYKVWLVIFQVIGYGLSKFLGIKIIAELKTTARAKGILFMVSIAGFSWLLFALTPPPYNIIFLFTNGLPLGMVWGMIFSYLEGRRVTEVLGATLSVSFIFSSGLCRTTGAYLIQQFGVSELWMPFVACCIFLPPLLLCLYLLNQVPPPNEKDIQLRTLRKPMGANERKQFIMTFLPGIILFTLCYVLLTVFRDFRDNFSAEVWNSLGYANKPEVFTKTEIPISIAVLLLMASLMVIKNNALALYINHILIAVGMILIGISTFLFEQQFINPTHWMMLIGLGLYMGYVPFNSIFFDRLLATFSFTGTVGFIMYVVDSAGYLGSIAMLLVKEFGHQRASWLSVFITSGYVLAIAGSLFIVASLLYFKRKRASYPETTVNA